MKTNRILIVDDKEENRYLLRALLQGHGYDVEEACHGAEALTRARQKAPDLIISDILMPVLDGFALCREWKGDALLKTVPFIFYTATYTDDRDRAFALSLGAERFIIKPEEPDAFLGIIIDVLRQVTAQQASGAQPTADSPARRPPDALQNGKEHVYLKQYNEALIRKLEGKMEELELSNRRLEHDIAERKSAEVAREKSETLFRTLTTLAPVGIYLTDPEGHCLYANPRWCEMAGMTLEEALGDGWRLGLHPDDRDRVFKAWRTMLETGTPWDLEYRFVTRQGQLAWVHGLAAPYDDASGQKIGYVGINQDITGRKRTEEALNESEHHFRTLADSGMALIWTAGTDKKCTYFNKRWMEFTGRTLGQELGDGWTEGVHPDDFARCVQTYSDAFDRQEPFSMNYRLRRHDGEYRWFQDVGTPRYDTKGAFLGYIGHCFDITELKKKEESSQQQLDELRRWHTAMLGRESRILELKGEVNELLAKAGQPIKYESAGSLETPQPSEAPRSRVEPV